MLRRNLENIILAVIIFAALLYLIVPVNFMLKGEPRPLAVTPHEDPGAAKPGFSGSSFLTFDADYLDLVLQMKPEELKAILNRWPFTHIPQSLKEAAEEFNASGLSLSQLLLWIDEDLDKLRALREQFRLDEATELAAQTSANLAQAESELKRIEQAIEIIDKVLKASSAPVQSDLRRAYDEITERTNRISERLALYHNQLTDSLTEIKKVEPLLKVTSLSLAIEPTVAFVGDNIRFEGVLTSETQPLAGREVGILVNSYQYATVRTDAYGRYQGTLPVPYWYLPELDLQALYYTRDKDIGVYLAASSPVIKVTALFYKAELKVTVADRAYPGRETTVTGRFDYGRYLPANERRVAIYFDGVPAAEVMAQEAFIREIKIGPEVAAGKHTITVSSGASGRYASANTSVPLNVTRATTVLDISLPGVALIPGSVRLNGKLYSEVSPLSGALIKIDLGKSRVELVSAKDGTFATKIKVGMGLGAIGWQALVIQALPQEPWQAPLNATSRILMVNVVNCGAFLAILLFLTIYLPGRLRRRLGAYPRVTAEPAMATVQPEPAPASGERVTAAGSTEGSDEASREPKDRIFYWYRLAVRLLQGMTKAWLGPQQTLREFARESSRILGPAAKYFIELTIIVERLLYSQYGPTEKDVEDSRQLSNTIQAKLRATTPPRFEPGGLSAAGGGVSTVGLWQQPSTWLWVLLILAVVYYACSLLFLLPLLGASLALPLPMATVDDLKGKGAKAVRGGIRR